MALVFRYKLVSHLPGSTTTTGNAFSGGAASFSPDGRYVLFESLASNLAGSDSNGGSDLFLYDSLDFSVDLVSHNPASTTTTANGPTGAGGAFFSPDDRYLLFQSEASNLAGGDLNGGTDLFLYNTQNNTSALVSHMSGSTTTTANNSSPISAASFSPDGRYVLFDSRATNLGAVAETNGAPDLFLYDTQDGSIDLVSHIPGSATTAGSGATFGAGAIFSPNGEVSATPW